MNKNLNKSLGKFYQKKENVQETLYGELGIPLNGKKTIDVPGRLGYVYVRLRGNASELVQAYNSTVPSKYDYPVVVARKGNKYTILGRDDQRFSNMGNAGNTVTSVNYSPVPNHGGQHSFSARNGIGADPTWVYGEQFMPNLIHPSGSSLQLAISPSFYEWEGQWKYPSTTGTIDLSPYVPTVTGSARFALLYIDGDTTEIKVAGGVGFSGGINNAAHLAQYIPDVDRNSSIPLAAVKLGTGTTSIDWTNIYDVRDYYTVAKYFEGIGIQDSTTAKGTGTILNFGNNLSVSMAGGVATIDATAGGGGGGGIGIMGWDEGIPLGTGTILNFVGDNVDASISGSVIRVHVTGSASGGNPPTTGSIVIIDEGVTKGSVTALNVVSSVADISVSGTVARLFITGSASGGSNPPVTGSVVLWDEGVLKGSATILDVVSSIADVSISGTVARLFITGSASSGGGTATYLRAGQPTPLAAHTTGTYWKTPESYATGSLAVFNQGHALIVDVDYSEQYPESGTYSYTEAQPTGTYHLAVYGVPASVASSSGGGRTLIGESSPSGTSTVTFSSIPNSYLSLEVEFVARSTVAANNTDIEIEFNGDTTATNYRHTRDGASAGGTSNMSGGDTGAIAKISGDNAPSNSCGAGKITIPYYALSTFKKQAQSLVSYRYDDSSAHGVVNTYGLEWENNSPITRIDLNLASGNYVYGSQFKLYGVPAQSQSGGSNPPITGSIVLWDEGVLKGSATTIDVVSSIADVSISGSVARLFITGSASSASLSGYMPYAFPLGYDIWANNSSDPLVANGGTVVIPIALSSTMLLQSVSCRNGDTGLARSWRWDLYVQSETSDTSLTRVATSDGSDSFTASGASIRTLNVSGAPVTVDPGLYWLAVQNDQASNTFDLRTHNSSVFQPNMIREKTTSVPNGASLDMSSGWSTLVHTRQIRLDGRVFGESSAF